MKIRKLWLNGYGRFFKRTLDLSPGLQVILGPNEQGKTTLRAFVGDMLYGQKRSSVQRIYDEANELRRPWHTPTCYGGEMVYVLDDGREIEVHRDFDRKQESVKVFDRARAQEITDQFEVLRNREPDFAQAHLGLSKSMYLGMASIGHAELEDLGDADALSQIRERLLALADTGEEEGTSEAALKRIEERIVSIGRDGTRTRPLPAARARLAEVEAEWEQAQALRRELAAMEEKRREALARVEVHREERARLEDEVRLLDRLDRARRLHEAEALMADIDEATKRCFALGSVREFPLDQQHEVQRSANLVATAQAQLQRTEAERIELERQLEEERKRLGGAAERAPVEFPEETEKRLAELESNIDRIRERLEEVEASVAIAERRYGEAQADLERLPDFSRLPSEPVLWLNQLANSFRMAQHSRENERQAHRKLQGQVARRRDEVSGPERVFSNVPDFGDFAREYQVEQRLFSEQEAQAREQVESLQAALDDHVEEAPGLGLMAVFLLVATPALVIAAFYFGNMGILVPAALCGLGFAYFVLGYTLRRNSAARTRQALIDAAQHLEDLRREWIARAAPMEELLREAGCATLREMEALYDKYREDRADLVSLVHSLEAQEARVHDEEERVDMLFEHVRDMFEQAGEEVHHEREVADAAARAIARYQEYRDAKRRSVESRDLLAHHKAEQKRLRDHLEAVLREERTLSLEARRIMREDGFPEEMKHDSALNALRAYRLRSAQIRQKRGRIEVLQEKLNDLGRRYDAEKKDLARHEETLARYLRRAGVATVEEWHERAEQAKTYREIWKHRSSVKQQLDTLLRGEDLEALRAAVDGGEPLPAAPERSREELKEAIEQAVLAIEEAQKEAHALHIAVTEHAAGMRSLNEIEEERADLTARIEELELDLEAAAYAYTAIESVARDTHARLAPRLAERASRYLREITDGAYSELHIGRDLRISVRIPQTSSLTSEPEKRLSKGTVDQIYLALRLALVQSLSENGESIPMLLDDPFANYDDDRLRRAMALLMEVSKRSQILLFTCREDVARAAQAVGAPVMKL